MLLNYREYEPIATSAIPHSRDVGDSSAMTMTATSFRSSVASSATRAVLVGGLIAGTLDAASAFYNYGRGMPLSIASGLLGRAALHGGAGTWALGLALHYLIACTAALVW